jgi:hypothetical protein
MVWSPDREAFLMRAHKVSYESILRVLGEAGCPFCRLVKKLPDCFASGTGKRDSSSVQLFHTWGLGETRDKFVAQWFRSQAVLCAVQGAKLKHGAPPIIVSTISAIMERCRRQLVNDISRLHSESLRDAERWGVLGRAAVSQRGPHA